MQTENIKPQLVHQINQFLTYTPDTDNDTIAAQYTVIAGLITQLIAASTLDGDSQILTSEMENSADYEYFLNVNTLAPQPIQRKGFALRGSRSVSYAP